MAQVSNDFVGLAEFIVYSYRRALGLKPLNAILSMVLAYVCCCLFSFQMFSFFLKRIYTTACLKAVEASGVPV